MDFLVGWGALLAGVAQIIGTRQLREHSDRYLYLEQELLNEITKPYHERDDVRYVVLKKELALVREAFSRDLLLAQGKS